MGDRALDMAAGAAPNPATDWSFRLCQRAFSALLEGTRQQGAFRVQQQRAAARRALSALSADARIDLSRWLGWQLLPEGANRLAPALALLGALDASLAARVRMELTQIAAELSGGKPADPAAA